MLWLFIACMLWELRWLPGKRHRLGVHVWLCSSPNMLEDNAMLHKCNCLTV